MQAAEELNFERLFAAAPVALLVLGPDLTILHATDTYLTATGTTRTALVGRPLFEVFPDDPGEQSATGVTNLRASLRRVTAELVTDVMPIQKYPIPAPGAPGRFETRYWAPANAPVLHADGSLAWIVHRTDDVTAFVQSRFGDPAPDDLAAGLAVPHAEMEATATTRQHLLAHNHALRAVLDSLDVIVIGCDDSGRAILHNRAARTLFELPETATPDDRWQHRVRMLDTGGQPLEDDRHPVRRVLDGAYLRDVEVVVASPGHPARHFLVNGRPVALTDRLTGLLALHEVTLQRRAERLKACELRISDVLGKPGPADQVLTDTIAFIGGMLGWAACEFWAIDEVGKVTRRQNCWHTENLTGPLCLPDQLGKGDGLAGRAWQETLPIWVSDLDTDPATRAHAPWHPLTSALAVPIPSGCVVLGILMLYSDLHETPDDMRTAVLAGIAAHVGEFLERRRAQQISSELERSRDDYIALVGHELRTPLTGIQSNAELLRADTDLTDSDREHMLGVIERRAHQLQDLVSSLLDVAGTRAGHTTLRPQRVDLAVLTRAAADAVRASSRATVDVNTPGPVIIEADPDRLREALDELLANAATWAPEDSIIGVHVHAYEHSVTVAVSNTGPRIPEDNHQRVFELFFRSDTLRHSGIPGSGLGLTLARAIVEQHQGTLNLSEPDEATTTFTIRLPRNLV